jgi:hypothetical protein
MRSFEATLDADICRGNLSSIETYRATPQTSPVPWRDWHPMPAVRASLLLHALAAGSLLAEWEAWPWALGSIIANQTALTALVMLPQSRLLGTNLIRLPKARAQAGHVALTFDDGPDPRVTPAVLDLLDRHGATASFFCIAEHALRHPELVREVVRRGH